MVFYLLFCQAAFNYSRQSWPDCLKYYFSSFASFLTRSELYVQRRHRAHKDVAPHPVIVGLAQLFVALGTARQLVMQKHSAGVSEPVVDFQTYDVKPVLQNMLRLASQPAH